VARLLWHVLSSPWDQRQVARPKGSNTMQDFTRGTVWANQLTFEYLPQGDGPLALCMHGVPDSPYSYSYLLPALADAGYRAFAASPLPNNVK
jgi:hypothetical protein